MPPLGIGALAFAGGAGATTATVTGGTLITAGTLKAGAWILGTAAVGGVAYANRDKIADAMSGAQTEAAEEDGEEAKTAAAAAAAAVATVTCATCAQNPCAHLACGAPPVTGNFRGGAHGCMALPVGDGLDSHHMPADSQSPLPRPVGPAIQMDPVDHQKTASYGARVRGPTYAPQRALLARGQTYAAFLADVVDARTVAAAQGNPTKYDEAIAQATLYAECLRRNGIIR